MLIIVVQKTERVNINLEQASKDPQEKAELYAGYSYEDLSPPSEPARY